MSKTKNDYCCNPEGKANNNRRSKENKKKMKKNEKKESKDKNYQN